MSNFTVLNIACTAHVLKIIIEDQACYLHPHFLNFEYKTTRNNPLAKGGGSTYVQAFAI
jgi:hypothetical protein